MTSPPGSVSLCIEKSPSKESFPALSICTHVILNDLPHLFHFTFPTRKQEHSTDKSASMESGVCVHCQRPECLSKTGCRNIPVEPSACRVWKKLACTSSCGGRRPCPVPEPSPGSASRTLALGLVLCMMPLGPLPVHCASAPLSAQLVSL